MGICGLTGADTIRYDARATFHTEEVINLPRANSQSKTRTQVLMYRMLCLIPPNLR